MTSSSPDRPGRDEPASRPSRPRRQCPGKDGTCRGGVTASGWCPSHDPDIPPEVKRARRSAGGLAAHQPLVQPNAPDPRFATAEDRQRFLEQVAGAGRRGELAPEIVHACISACRVAGDDQRAGERLQVLRLPGHGGGPALTIELVLIEPPALPGQPPARYARVLEAAPE